MKINFFSHINIRMSQIRLAPKQTSTLQVYDRVSKVQVQVLSKAAVQVF
jgi:hypothetical protein